jgi:uncharacterized protein YjbI with pentapeptide repeats
MANAEQLALLKAGVEGWNKWRRDKWGKKIDLRGANLSFLSLVKANLYEADLTGANLLHTVLREVDLLQANLKDAELFGAVLVKAELTRANLHRANLHRADLTEADLSEANLTEADLSEADLTDAVLQDANLTKADLSQANLTRAYFVRAKLTRANLTKAEFYEANFQESNLAGADLTEAHLNSCNLISANIHNAKISKSDIYGINVWDLEGEFKEQKDLIITPKDASPITVDNIKVAQFVYLILNNKEIRDVINTLTSKSVLILGRFALPERKAILDALRDKLREYNLLPIVFDFDSPTDKDFTETIKTLAGMCYFVIADVTNPKSSPLELQATVPDYQIPFVPIIQEGEHPFAMMVDLQKKYNWVLDTISYDSLETLLEILKPHIIDPAIKKRDELRLIKAKEPTIISGRQLKDKKKQSKP